MESVPVVAITLGFLKEVLLVLIVRREVGGGSRDSSGHFEWLKFGLGDFLIDYQVLNLVLDFFSDYLLLLRMIEDGGGVLRTLVLLLPVVSCRVMEGEQELDKVFVRCHFVVETDLENLNMACVLWAYLFVAWVLRSIDFGGWAHEPHWVSQHRAWLILLVIYCEVLFSAPVASGAESG